MNFGFSLFAIVAFLFCLYFSPSTAGNQVSCQMSKHVHSGIIFISADAIYPEINGRIPDEDKNFTGSVKDPTIINFTETKLNLSLTQAAIKAEELTGNNSRVVDAKLATRNGYIVYEILLAGQNSDRPFAWLIVDPASGERFDTKMSCGCDVCKQFAGKWICTGCRCNS